MVPIGKSLKQETCCHGTLNGHAFKLVGGGNGKPFDGMVHTSLKSTNGPLPFPVVLLSPVLIMGYPTFSNYHRGAFDLFKLSNGYNYERHFQFENGGHMDTVHKIAYQSNKLVGDFHVVSADVKFTDLLDDVEPAVETFIPAGPGEIESSFVIAWRLREGGFFRAYVQSEYHLTHNAQLPYPQFRHITFDTKCTADGIEQTESLNVFRDLTEVRF